MPVRSLLAGASFNFDTAMIAKAVDNAWALRARLP